MEEPASFVCSHGESLFSEILREVGCRICLSIPSFILYCLVLWAIKVNRLIFSATFVHLFTLTCYYSMTSWIGDFFFTTILLLSPLCEPLEAINDTYFISVPYFFYNFFPLSNFGCAIAISLHQLTAVYDSLNVEQIWSDFSRKITILTIVFPFIACLHILFGKMVIIPMPNGIIYMKVDHLSSAINFIRSPAVNSLCGVAAFIIILSCTSASVFKICTIGRENSHRVYKRVFLVACWMSTTSLIYAVYQICISYARFISQDDLRINYIVRFRSTVCDVCFLPLPRVVILVNNKIRATILSGFKMPQKGSLSANSVARIAPIPPMLKKIQIISENTLVK